MARQQFPFYKSFDDVAEDLTDIQLSKYIRTLLDVQFLRIKIDDVNFTDKTLSIVWKSQKHSISKSINGFIDGQRRETIKNPYFGVYDDSYVVPNEGIREGMQTPKLQVQGKEEGKEQGKGKGEVQVSSGFKKPTINDIQTRCFQMKYRLDAEKFFNYYESNGWKVGRNKMKSWHSALANWNKNDNSKQQPKSFQQQERDRTDAIADVVLNQGVNPFDPANYEQQKEYTDVQLTN